MALKFPIYADNSENQTALNNLTFSILAFKGKCSFKEKIKNSVDFFNDESR